MTCIIILLPGNVGTFKYSKLSPLPAISLCWTECAFVKWWKEEGNIAAAKKEEDSNFVKVEQKGQKNENLKQTEIATIFLN